MAEDLFKPYKKLYDSFSTFRSDRNDWQALIDGTDVIDLGKMYHDTGLRYHSPRARHEWNQYTAILDTASVTYAFESRTDEADDKESAQTAEHWFNAYIQLARGGKIDPLRLCRSYRAAKGVGILKLDFDGPWLQNKQGVPFILSCVDPNTCAWFEDDKEVPLFVEHSERALNPVLKAFNLGYETGTFYTLGSGQPVESSPEGYLETVTVTQVSTPETVSFWARGKAKRGESQQPTQHLRTFPNPWGGVPYIIIPALITANATDLSKRFQPLIYNTLEMVRYENHMKSLLFLAARLTAAPIYDVVTETGEPFMDPETGAPMVIEVDPGHPMKYLLPPGAKLVQREIKMGVDNHIMLEVIRAEQDRVGFPTGLLGDAPQPRTPAFAYAQAQGAASVFIDPATRAEAAGLLQLQELVGNCIKNYIGSRGPVEIRVRSEDESGEAKTLSIGPDDIGEHDVRVQVDVPITSLEMARKELDRKDMNEGTLSPDTYMKNGGITDVDRENRLINDADLRRELRPSTRAHAIQIINERVQRELGSPMPVPENATGLEQPPAQGRTRPAQQVRPAGLEPNPAEEVMV